MIALPFGLVLVLDVALLLPLLELFLEYMSGLWLW
jgi:hypothetical protein